MERDRALEESLVDAIADPSVELLTDGAEVLLDQVLREGPLRELPVVGTVIRLGKAGLAVRDYLFLRKVSRFLVRLRDIPMQERERFVRDASDPKTRAQIGETLLLLLDKADDARKADLLAAVMKRYVLGRVDLATLRALAGAVDRCFVDDLPSLKDLRAKKQVPPEVGVRLFSTGLVHQLAVLPVGGPGAFGSWGLTPLGETFVTLLLDDDA